MSSVSVPSQRRDVRLDLVRVRLYKETEDSWYGTYTIDGTKVVLVTLDSVSPYGWRIVVKGCDKFGLELVVPTLVQARVVLCKLVETDGVWKDDLVAQGFMRLE